MQKRQSSSVVASVAINLAQLYEDVNLSTVKMHPPSGNTQSGQNVDPFVDDEGNFSLYQEFKFVVCKRYELLVIHQHICLYFL